jgi:hypothetical protein
VSEDDIVSERVHARGLHLARVLCTTRSVSLVSRRASARADCGAEYDIQTGREMQMAKFADSFS